MTTTREKTRRPGRQKRRPRRLGAGPHPTTGGKSRTTSSPRRLRPAAHPERDAKNLRHSNHLYTSLFHHAWHGIVVADRQGRFLDVNPAACELFGLSRSKLLRLRFDHFRQDYSRTRYKRLLDGKLRPPVVRGDHTLLRRDGTKRLLDALGVRLDRDRAMLIIRDVSEKRQAEEKLRASEEMFRSMIRHAGLGIAYTGLDGKHVDVNEAFCKMTGFSRDELIGCGMPYPYWPAEVTGRFTDSMRKALEGGIAIAETLFLRKDGSRFPVRIHPSVVRDHTGATVGVLGVFEDISSLKALQDELAYSQRIQTAGALAGGIAHEFSSIHLGIHWSIEQVLTLPDLPGAIREDLEVALAALQRASRIIKQLEAYSSRSPSQKTRCRLSDVVNDALELASRELEAGHVAVRVEHGQDMPELVVDPTQIGQVVLNLILNAKEAMSLSATKNLSVETGAEEQRMFVRVTDSGCGIPQEYLDHIFQSFITTKDDPNTGTVRGFGFGLPISDKIVRDHGGAIEVSTKVGIGSVFTVWLPVEPPRVASRVILSLGTLKISDSTARLPRRKAKRPSRRTALKPSRSRKGAR